MSSNESTTDNDSAAKRKRATRPCDICRRKKRRCDGEHPCGPCLKHDFGCTYQQRPRQRISTATSYVHSLENRLQEAEARLRKAAHPGTSTPIPPPRTGPGVEIVTQIIRGLTKPYPPAHSDDLSFVEIEDSFKSLSLDNPGDSGFQGKSSHAMMVKTALDLKTGSRVPGLPRNSIPGKSWSVKPWESGHPPPLRTFAFPDPDLMATLIALYFNRVNVFFPVLHRPTFQRAFGAGTHLREDGDGFARVLLLVCALGARYAEDARVYLPQAEVDASDAYGYGSTAGWRWFDEVQITCREVLRQPTLEVLQCFALAVQFLDRTSSARACWTAVGIGLHLGKDLGAHRAKPQHPHGLTAEHELQRRAYWTLTLFDSEVCGILGRTPAIHAMDFDLDPPARCDDEYWDSDFRQPPETPAVVDFFCALMDLNRIFAFTHKVLYSSTKIRALVAMGDDGSWEEKIVMELDSQLNAWFDALPPHLRWDATSPDDVFFDQSAALYCKYYLLQILIHRPFIPAIRHTTKLATTFPSLTICNNAARACIHVAETQQRRRPGSPVVFVQTAMFTAGIVLLLNIWSGSPAQRDRSSDALRDVHRCMAVLRAHKEHWPSVGPSLNTLEQLLKVDRERAPMGVKPRRKEYEYENDPSPFVGSAYHEESRTSSPTSGHGTSRWIPTTADDIEWANDHVIPGEAPARAPHAAGGAATTVWLQSQPQSHDQMFDVPDPGAFFASDPLQYSGASDPTGLQSLSNYDPTDIMAIWDDAPAGFGVSDWDLYLRDLGDIMMQGQAQVAME